MDDALFMKLSNETEQSNILVSTFNALMGIRLSFYRVVSTVSSFIDDVVADCRESLDDKAVFPIPSAVQPVEAVRPAVLKKESPVHRVSKSSDVNATDKKDALHVHSLLALFIFVLTIVTLLTFIFGRCWRRRLATGTKTISRRGHFDPGNLKSLEQYNKVRNYGIGNTSTNKGPEVLRTPEKMHESPLLPSSCEVKNEQVSSSDMVRGSKAGSSKMFLHCVSFEAQDCQKIVPKRQKQHDYTYASPKKNDRERATVANTTTKNDQSEAFKTRWNGGSMKRKTNDVKHRHTRHGSSTSWRQPNVSQAKDHKERRQKCSNYKDRVALMARSSPSPPVRRPAVPHSAQSSRQSSMSRHRKSTPSDRKQVKSSKTSTKADMPSMLKSATPKGQHESGRIRMHRPTHLVSKENTRKHSKRSPKKAKKPARKLSGQKKIQKIRKKLKAMVNFNNKVSATGGKNPPSPEKIPSDCHFLHFPEPCRGIQAPGNFGPGSLADQSESFSIKRTATPVLSSLLGQGAFRTCWPQNSSKPSQTMRNFQVDGNTGRHNIKFLGMKARGSNNISETLSSSKFSNGSAIRSKSRNEENESHQCYNAVGTISSRAVFSKEKTQEENEYDRLQIFAVTPCTAWTHVVKHVFPSGNRQNTDLKCPTVDMEELNRKNNIRTPIAAVELHFGASDVAKEKMTPREGWAGSRKLDPNPPSASEDVTSTEILWSESYETQAPNFRTVETDGTRRRQELITPASAKKRPFEPISGQRFQTRKVVAQGRSFSETSGTISKVPGENLVKIYRTQNIENPPLIQLVTVPQHRHEDGLQTTNTNPATDERASHSRQKDVQAKAASLSPAVPQNASTSRKLEDSQVFRNAPKASVTNGDSAFRVTRNNVPTCPGHCARQHCFQESEKTQIGQILSQQSGCTRNEFPVCDKDFHPSKSYEVIKEGSHGTRNTDKRCNILRNEYGVKGLRDWSKLTKVGQENGVVNQNEATGTTRKDKPNSHLNDAFAQEGNLKICSSSKPHQSWQPATGSPPLLASEERSDTKTAFHDELNQSNSSVSFTEEGPRLENQHSGHAEFEDSGKHNQANVTKYSNWHGVAVTKPVHTQGHHHDYGNRSPSSKIQDKCSGNELIIRHIQSNPKLQQSEKSAVKTDIFCQQRVKKTKSIISLRNMLNELTSQVRANVDIKSIRQSLCERKTETVLYLNPAQRPWKRRSGESDVRFHWLPKTEAFPQLRNTGRACRLAGRGDQEGNVHYMKCLRLRKTKSLRHEPYKKHVSSSSESTIAPSIDWNYVRNKNNCSPSRRGRYVLGPLVDKQCFGEREHPLEEEVVEETSSDSTTMQDVQPENNDSGAGTAIENHASVCLVSTQQGSAGHFTWSNTFSEQAERGNPCSDHVEAECSTSGRALTETLHKEDKDKMPRGHSTARQKPAAPPVSRTAVLPSSNIEPIDILEVNTRLMFDGYKNATELEGRGHSEEQGITGHTYGRHENVGHTGTAHEHAGGAEDCQHGETCTGYKSIAQRLTGILAAELSHSGKIATDRQTAAHTNIKHTACKYVPVLPTAIQRATLERAASARRPAGHLAKPVSTSTEHEASGYIDTEHSNIGHTTAGYKFTGNLSTGPDVSAHCGGRLMSKGHTTRGNARGGYTTLRHGTTTNTSTGHAAQRHSSTDQAVSKTASAGHATSRQAVSDQTSDGNRAAERVVAGRILSEQVTAGHQLQHLAPSQATSLDERFGTKTTRNMSSGYISTAHHLHKGHKTIEPITTAFTSTEQIEPGQRDTVHTSLGHSVFRHTTLPHSNVGGTISKHETKPPTSIGHLILGLKTSKHTNADRTGTENTNTTQPLRNATSDHMTTRTSAAKGTVRRTCTEQRATGHSVAERETQEHTNEEHKTKGNSTVPCGLVNHTGRQTNTALVTKEDTTSRSSLQEQTDRNKTSAEHAPENKRKEEINAGHTARDLTKNRACNAQQSNMAHENRGHALEHTTKAQATSGETNIRNIRECMGQRQTGAEFATPGHAKKSHTGERLTDRGSQNIALSSEKSKENAVVLIRKDRNIDSASDLYNEHNSFLATDSAYKKLENTDNKNSPKEKFTAKGETTIRDSAFKSKGTKVPHFSRSRLGFVKNDVLLAKLRGIRRSVSFRVPLILDRQSFRSLAKVKQKGKSFTFANQMSRAEGKEKAEDTAPSTQSHMTQTDTSVNSAHVAVQTSPRLGTATESTSSRLKVSRRLVKPKLFREKGKLKEQILSRHRQRRKTSSDDLTLAPLLPVTTQPASLLGQGYVTNLDTETRSQTVLTTGCLEQELHREYSIPVSDVEEKCTDGQRQDCTGTPQRGMFVDKEPYQITLHMEHSRRGMLDLSRGDAASSSSQDVQEVCKSGGEGRLSAENVSEASQAWEQDEHGIEAPDGDGKLSGGGEVGRRTLPELPGQGQSRPTEQESPDEKLVEKSQFSKPNRAVVASDLGSRDTFNSADMLENNSWPGKGEKDHSSDTLEETDIYESTCTSDNADQQTHGLGFVASHEAGDTEKLDTSTGRYSATTGTSSTPEESSFCRRADTLGASGSSIVSSRLSELRKLCVISPVWTKANIEEIDRRVRRALRLREDLKRSSSSGFPVGSFTRSYTEPSATESTMNSSDYTRGGASSTLVSDIESTNRDTSFPSAGNYPAPLPVEDSEDALSRKLDQLNFPEQESSTSGSESTRHEKTADSHFGSNSTNTANKGAPLCWTSTEMRTSGCATADQTHSGRSFIYEKQDEKDSNFHTEHTSSLHEENTSVVASQREATSTETESSHPSNSNSGNNSMKRAGTGDNNSPPTKISKVENISSTTPRLVGSLIQKLPQVPLSSFVEWFIETSDPNNFVSSDRSSSSSEDSPSNSNTYCTKIVAAEPQERPAVWLEKQREHGVFTGHNSSKPPLHPGLERKIPSQETTPFSQHEKLNFTEEKASSKGHIADVSSNIWESSLQAPFSLPLPSTPSSATYGMSSLSAETETETALNLKLEKPARSYNTPSDAPSSDNDVWKFVFKPTADETSSSRPTKGLSSKFRCSKTSTNSMAVRKGNPKQRYAQRRGISRQANYSTDGHYDESVEDVGNSPEYGRLLASTLTPSSAHEGRSEMRLNFNRQSSTTTSCRMDTSTWASGILGEPETCSDPARRTSNDRAGESFWGRRRRKEPDRKTESEPTCVSECTAGREHTALTAEEQFQDEGVLKIDSEENRCGPGIRHILMKLRQATDLDERAASKGDNMKTALRTSLNVTGIIAKFQNDQPP